MEIGQKGGVQRSRLPNRYTGQLFKSGCRIIWEEVAKFSDLTFAQTHHADGTSCRQNGGQGGNK